MSSSPSLSAERKHWWLTNKKIVDKYVRDARSLVATQEPADVSVALGLLEAALALSPRLEVALELKARCLLYLRRFREVADMLQDYIPSYRLVATPSDETDSSTSLGSSSSCSSDHSTSHRAKLLPEGEELSDGDGGLFRCFSIADLKRRVLAGICRSCNKEGQWRYLVLGQACCHLGLMEDAMVLLQTGRRLATAAFRRESVCWSDDSFIFSNSTPTTPPSSPTPPPSESESATQLLTHIKLLLRRRAAALAALDAGLPNEAVRHFSKILDGRRGTPHAFAAGCFVGRAAAYRSADRLAEAIADCNRALALDPTSISALRARADLLESVRALPDCLRDLDHLKLLYDSILRDRKLPGPAWRPHHDVRYRDIATNLRALTHRIQEIRLRVVAAGDGGGGGMDYYALMGVRRGCTRSELGRAHLLLSLRHKPDKAMAFVDRLEFAGDHRDLDTVRDQARMSALILYRMLQKGYSSIMAAVMDEEAKERQRVKEAATAAAKVAEKKKVEKSLGPTPAGLKSSLPERQRVKEAATGAPKVAEKKKVEKSLGPTPAGLKNSLPEKSPASVFQGVFCRDLAAVGSLISQVGFNRAIPVKYEALSC